MQWSPAPQKRDQMVLFSRRLDDAVAIDHNVRLLDAILGRIDWSPWEAGYHGRLGQPPIPPRVLAGAILYGLLTRIRSSRRLEEALTVRLDFMWLVEGRTIDHTTLSEFRRRHADQLKNLFVQIGLLARELGWVTLQQLAYDGTRLRANNRRGGTRTPEALREMQEELKRKFAELEALAAQEDSRDDETFGTAGSHTLPGDGAMCSGANLAALEELGTTLYSPMAVPDPATNPALRPDPTQPVPPDAWDRLPMKEVKNRSGEMQPQLEKEAFVYDAQRDCYWCPQGQKLSFVHKTSEPTKGGRAARSRYKADAVACAACPLRDRCLQKGAPRRQVSRDQHETLRERHVQRMATPEAQEKYKKRREVAEMPFAVIKDHFGARRFLLRGLDQVRTEWRWLATAFNLHKMISLLRARAGPAAALSLSNSTPA
jgi:transposase